MKFKPWDIVEYYGTECIFITYDKDGCVFLLSKAWRTIFTEIKNIKALRHGNNPFEQKKKKVVQCGNCAYSDCSESGLYFCRHPKNKCANCDCEIGHKDSFFCRFGKLKKEEPCA